MQSTKLSSTPENVVELHQLLCPTGGTFPLRIDRLSIKAGEKIAIVGPNGAGKSTLFRLLSGFQRPTAGTALVLGHALHTRLTPTELRDLRCHLGQILQGLHLVQRISVLDNVLIGNLGKITGWQRWRSYIRYYRPTEMMAAKQALAAVGLQERAMHRTDFLSGGEKQKAAIARLLLQNPKLILADEPTAALDPGAANEIGMLMHQLSAANPQVAMISVLHNPSLIPLFANRVIGMRQGCIEFDVPFAKLEQQRLDALYQNNAQSNTQNHAQSTAHGQNNALNSTP